jgi:hypothetical protein
MVWCVVYGFAPALVLFRLLRPGFLCKSPSFPRVFLSQSARLRGCASASCFLCRRLSTSPRPFVDIYAEVGRLRSIHNRATPVWPLAHDITLLDILKPDGINWLWRDASSSAGLRMSEDLDGSARRWVSCFVDTERQAGVTRALVW